MINIIYKTVYILLSIYSTLKYVNRLSEGQIHLFSHHQTILPKLFPFFCHKLMSRQM